ncbi:bifunctional diguanylate cyclase/phosphodiesterase [uncultured Cellulomonas sp.]|uniref:putative bifunctional diguanylate cyclase/phosphodiesterase n=1 Tax=uncultured Cellulomonas sp. TaxID=189682 RepID=UPI002625751D|nr:EAL domain-containing protein [uncultured Cellulomonas sp.]
MSEAASSIAVVTQSVIAGLVAGLCLLQVIWWRSDRGRSGSGWLLTWTVAIAVLLSVNIGLSTLAVTDGSYSSVVFVRAQVLAVCVVLAVPTVRAFTGGPPVRPWVIAATAAFALRAGIWLTTDLVLVDGSGAAMARGPLSVPTFCLPLAAVAAYVVLALRRVRDRRTLVVIAGTSVVSVVLLTLPYLAPVGPWTHPLTVVWTVPLAGGLTALGLRRLAVVERDARRQHAMRDAVADLGTSAWYATDADGLLVEAESAAQRVLRDPSIHASLEPLPRGRFAARLVGAGGPSEHDDTRRFLDELARVVSTAAERITLGRDLERAAFTDSLTGLPNRRALDRHLADVLVRARQDRSRQAVLHCDIDGFKVENDLHGHTWGDELLVRTAAHLRRCVAADDVVARFGGDEFVVVVQQPGSDDELVALANRIRHGLTDDGDRALPLLSVGVAGWCPLAGGEPDHLLRQAGTAMLESKRRRSGVVVFDDALRARMQADEELRRELGIALVEDEFTAYFQPVVEAASMRVVGVEVLARWDHGGRIRMPGEWLSFAEETGLIVPIGRRVLAVARTGAQGMGLPVMVNVAARQLAEPGFVDQLIADWGSADWRTLTLEITESALLQDIPHVLAALQVLRGLGARIAIDDFGTGYSSFARLATLPVDVLKIDRAFVDAVTTDQGRAVVAAIVSLADAYDLDVVAEGVETVQQLDALVELGVPKLQGYLLGRPAPGRPRPVAVPRPAPAAQS